MGDRRGIFFDLSPQAVGRKEQGTVRYAVEDETGASSHGEFVVMILHGPNERLDFHVEPGEEFFYQIVGDIELHLKPPGERRHMV